MTEIRLHSLVLAADYRVPDIEQMWQSLRGRESDLAGIGAHHVVVYASAWESGRVFVTIGVHHREPVPELLRSPVIFEWFDVAGLDDIPAVFAGEVVEKLDLYPGSSAPGVVVAAMASVDNLGALIARAHSAVDRFRAAGVRQIWVYQAFDNDREVLILQELDDEMSARQWLDHPDAAAEWISGAGRGPYPPVFVGRFAHMMTIRKERPVGSEERPSVFEPESSP